jgi:hypothetical protein
MDAAHRFLDLKDSVQDSLKDFSMAELHSMNDDLIVLIDSLIQRQIALQEVILDRLDTAYHAA